MSHPETHSPTGCAVKAREQTRAQYQRDSAHVLGAEAHDRGVTHRQPGWNIESSRQELHQRLNQRVQTLKESTGRAGASASMSSSSSSSSSRGGAGGGGGSTSGGGVGGAKGKGKGKGKKPAGKSWGSGGSRLGGVPGTGVPGGEI
ncbi:hypothetical protein BG004_008281 [Podila humilis]|nr:hypothetical protein BG004_008281 [Podila humilis]